MGAEKKFPSKSPSLYQPKDGKRTIRDCKRLLCKICLSDEHLLCDYPKLTPIERVQQAKEVFSLLTDANSSLQCIEVLDRIQEFDDNEWETCLHILENEEMENAINWTCVIYNSHTKVPSNTYEETMKELVNRALAYSRTPDI